MQSAWFESTKVSLARLCRLKTPQPWQPRCFVLVSYSQFPSQMRRPWRPASHTPQHCSHNTQISDLPAKFDEWPAKAKKLSDSNIFQSYLYLLPLQPGSCLPTATDQIAAKQNGSNEGRRAEPVSDCSWHLCASTTRPGRSISSLMATDYGFQVSQVFQSTRIVNVGSYGDLLLAWCLQNLSGHAWRQCV